MDRRTYLRTAATGAVGLAGATAGCIGGGGEVVVNVQRTVTVQPGASWHTEIPDVSGEGGAISYVAKADAPFDVYFFLSEDQYDRYRAYLHGETDGGSLPAGDQEIGRTATQAGQHTYRASTDDDGARQPIDAAGPYYFVVDHSDYPPAGGAFPRDPPERRRVSVSLTVTKQQFSLPF
ncbi:MAG: hypothetical protein ABEJ31_10205 [Haloarculaceae archaeon]